MFLKSLIEFLVLISGCAIAIRIFSDIKKYFKLQKTSLCFHFYYFYLFLSLFCFEWTTFQVWIVVFLPLFFIHQLVFYFIDVRNKRFYEAFSIFLDKVLLKMQSGVSFRNAFYDSCLESDAFVQQKLRPLLESVLFPQQKTKLELHDSFLKDIYRELLRLQRHRHYAILLLQEWRCDFMRRKKIRHRSGQLSLQARLQSYILMLFYLLLCFFNFYQYKFETFETWFWLSLVFMIGGFWCLKCLAKKMIYDF